jgi:hypothetical protein
MNSTMVAGSPAPKPAAPAAKPAAQKPLINKHYRKFSRFSRLVKWIKHQDSVGKDITGTYKGVALPPLNLLNLLKL